VPGSGLLPQGRVTQSQLDTSLLGRGTATEEDVVNQPDWMAEQFESHRAHLRAVAYRMLGSASEADDAVQEAWLRLSRADTSDVANLGGWLTTVVARVCLDMLRSRTSRREEPLGTRPGEPDGRVNLAAPAAEGTDPEHEAVLADSVGLALLVVLETLAPAERVAFVLHDMFAVPYEEIGAMLDRSPSATKQLASRARRRVQGSATVPDTDLYRQREAVGAFFAASRNGDFDALLAMLDPDVVVRPDRAVAQASSLGEVRGAEAVASNFARIRARGAQIALVDGIPAGVWAPGGELRVVFSFTFMGGKITSIDALADPGVLGRLDVTILSG
jgi:RNA polymerase sigma factor (sigma-70 family)